MLLNQRILQEQGIKLGLGDDGLDVGHLAHQHAQPGGLVVLMKVGPNALLEVFGLADV